MVSSTTAEAPLHAQTRDPGPWPFVTIVMPCLDEAAHLESCLAGVLGQDYPRERLEVLVADGGSTDGTRSLLERWAASDRRLRVIDNPDRYQAPGLNALLRQARGEVIVRMDVHCEYAPDYVRRCVEVLERTGADNAGGAQRARATTAFQRALCAALRSPLGVGGARYRSAEAEGFVDTVFLGAFRRRAFETAGLYDPGAITNEDAELNQRILAAGGRIYLSPEIVVHYEPRRSFPALARQYFRYGRGRARTFVKWRGFPTWRPLAPAVLVIGFLTLAVASPLRVLLPWVLGAYALALAAEGWRVTRGAGVNPAVVALIFAVLHGAHGTGFLEGLVRYGFAPDWRPAERLPAREKL